MSFQLTQETDFQFRPETILLEIQRRIEQNIKTIVDFENTQTQISNLNSELSAQGPEKIVCRCRTIFRHAAIRKCDLCASANAPIISSLRGQIKNLQNQLKIIAPSGLQFEKDNLARLVKEGQLFSDEINIRESFSTNPQEQQKSQETGKGLTTIALLIGGAILLT